MNRTMAYSVGIDTSIVHDGCEHDPKPMENAVFLMLEKLIEKMLPKRVMRLPHSARVQC